MNWEVILTIHQFYTKCSITFSLKKERELGDIFLREFHLITDIMPGCKLDRLKTGVASLKKREEHKNFPRMKWTLHFAFKQSNTRNYPGGVGKSKLWNHSDVKFATESVFRFWFLFQMENEGIFEFKFSHFRVLQPVFNAKIIFDLFIAFRRGNILTWHFVV